jgi:hypothetical protein
VSASSINRAANDPQLQARVLALSQKELMYNNNLRNTVYGKQLLQGFNPNVMALMWPLAANQETQYENALKAGRGAPGFDTDIITDDAILSAVISFWPPDPEPPTAPGTQAAPALVIPPEAT